MKKIELFEKAHKEGIILTPSQLRRYVEYGCIKTTHVGRGYARGVVTEYPENTLEIIKRIKVLQPTHKLKDIIFILWWKGYLVCEEKLKHQLLRYFDDLNKYIHLLAYIDRDLDTKKWLLEDIAEYDLPQKQPGRPSKEQLHQMDKKRSKKINTMNHVISLIAELAQRGRISNGAGKLFFRQIDFVVDKVGARTDWMDLVNGVIV
jgi:hypothetical protein